MSGQSSPLPRILPPCPPIMRGSLIWLLSDPLSLTVRGLLPRSPLVVLLLRGHVVLLLAPLIWGVCVPA